MNQDKKIQIVMLATDKQVSKGQIAFDGISCELLLFSVAQYLNYGGEYSFQPQHLYFLSDDEIKYDLSLLNTFIYNSKENKIDKITSKADILFIIEENKESNTFKKIIASTDDKLRIDSTIRSTDELDYGKVLNMIARPSKEWLKYFVSEYNKGSIIKEVFVEYEKY